MTANTQHLSISGHSTREVRQFCSAIELQSEFSLSAGTRAEIRWTCTPFLLAAIPLAVWLPLSFIK